MAPSDLNAILHQCSEVLIQLITQIKSLNIVICLHCSTDFIISLLSVDSEIKQFMCSFLFKHSYHL